MPIGVTLLVGVAVVVIGLLLLQAAVAFFFWLLRLTLIAIGFVAIAYVGRFLLRRGESS